MRELIRDLLTSPVAAAALPGLLAEFSAQPELHASLLARFADGFAMLNERLSGCAAKTAELPKGG